MDINHHRTVAQFANGLGVSKQRIRKLISQDRLAHVKIGRIYLIPDGATVKPPQRRTEK